MKSITDAGAKLMPLKETTFRFVEALYVALPPMSRELPPGDKAVMAIGPSGEVMTVIVNGEQTCARFMVPMFITEMIANVESGNTSSAVPGKDL